MNHLIIIAHGSRKSESNLEVLALAAQLKKKLSGNYSEVNAAFQELALPNIATAVANAKLAGATRIDLFPYFLVAGKHVSFDLPKLIKQIQMSNKELQIQMLPYLGALPNLSDFIAHSIKD